MNRLICTVAVFTFTCSVSAQSKQPSPSACGGQSGAVLQVIGSGGPMHGGGRGSSAYLIWYRGNPSIVVDMGGGTVTGLARVGVSAGRIDALLLSHLHPDHVSDLPEFLWSELVAERTRALAVVGPSGGNGFPSARKFLERQFGPAGAFPYMQELLTGGAFELDVHVVDADDIRPGPVLQQGELRVAAYPVPHGKAPTLAYRIDGADFSVVFGGDQTGRDPEFARFARSATVLVLHAMLSPSAANHPLTDVVALPRDLGKRAAEAGAKRVVLSHLMSSTAEGGSNQWSLSSLDAVLASMRSVYEGGLSVASDLECFSLE